MGGPQEYTGVWGAFSGELQAVWTILSEEHSCSTFLSSMRWGLPCLLGLRGPSNPSTGRACTSLDSLQGAGEPLQLLESLC